MVLKLALYSLLMQIWIITVDSQFENLFGGGLGNALGGGNGGLGGGNGGMNGGNGLFGGGNQGFGGGNGLFGGGNQGLGGENGLFGGGGGWNQGFGGGGQIRPFWFHSSRLNRAVRAIVHPNARPTSPMLDISFRHSGPPRDQKERMEYIPHFAQLAMDMGVLHPNVTGVPTIQQMSDLMLKRGSAYFKAQQKNRNRNIPSNTGSSSNNGSQGAINPTINLISAASTGNVGSSSVQSFQNQNTIGPAYTVNQGQNIGHGSSSGNGAPIDNNISSTAGQSSGQASGGNDVLNSQSTGNGIDRPVQNNQGSSQSLLNDLLMLQFLSQPNTASGQEGNPLMSMLNPMFAANENPGMMNGLNPLMINNNENLMIMNSLGSLLLNNENRMTNNANSLMMGNQQQTLMQLLNI